MKSLSKFLSIVIALVCVASTTDNRQSRTDFYLIPIPATAVHHGWSGRPHFRNADLTSQNWSGYVVATNLGSPKNNAVTEAQGSWTVPTVHASTSRYTYSSIWVGLDGYTDDTVEQTGTEQDWDNGKAAYYAWVEMYPAGAFKIANFPVAPGDAITANCYYISNEFVLTIINHTRNVSYATIARLNGAARRSAEWVVEAPYSNSILPLANFGVVNFLNCAATMNGVTGPINSRTWQNEEVIMTTGRTVKAQPSALSPAGTAFSVTWHHE